MLSPLPEGSESKRLTEKQGTRTQVVSTARPAFVDSHAFCHICSMSYFYLCVFLFVDVKTFFLNQVTVNYSYDVLDLQPIALMCNS